MNELKSRAANVSRSIKTDWTPTFDATYYVICLHADFFVFFISAQIAALLFTSL